MDEEAFFHLLAAVHARHLIPDLALAGGCAMNSVANGKIYHNTPFKRAYIQSAAGDAGGAIGAAFSVWHGMDGSEARFVIDHAFWGPELDRAPITEVVWRRQYQEVQPCRIQGL